MPIPITAEDIANVAPELAISATLTEERINLFIDYARLYVSENKFGPKAKLGIILMCAHMLTKYGSGSGGGYVGGIASESVADISVSYAAPTIQGSASDQILNTTTYGQQYLMLRRTIPMGPLVT